MEPQTPTPVILVATDFSETADAALDWAVEVARQQGGRVELVHAVGVPPSVPGFVPTAGTGFEADVRQAADARMAQTVTELRTRGVEVSTYLGQGTASQVILQRAQTIPAAAVVIGTRGLTSLRHRLMGSTAQRVVHGAGCPVLTVHPGDMGKHRAIRTILVPTDFSEDAEVAIQAAHRLLAGLESDARLILVHAFNMPIEYTAYGPIPTSVDYMKDTGLEAERRLYEMVQPLQREGLSIETLAREGDPAHVIAEEAESRGADLIAMGTHGRTGLRHLLLGSTAERVVEHAPCPVMTIRADPNP